MPDYVIIAGQRHELPPACEHDMTVRAATIAALEADAMTDPAALPTKPKLAREKKE